MELVNKISVKNCVENVKGNIGAKCLTVVGLASDLKTGETQYGEYCGFKGQFKAVNEEGTEYQSGVCFLPTIATDLLRPAVEAADGEPVQFAFDIGTKKSDNKEGYEYTVSPLIDNEGGSVLDNLMQKALGTGE